MIDIDKLKLLHAIRGAAAFVVVICHSKFPFWSGGVEYTMKYPRTGWNILDYFLFGIDMLTSNGTAMVILFFVLSGFFIAYSFHKNNWKYVDFYTNRFLRIYIPYFFSIVFAIAAILLAKEICPVLFSERTLSREFNSSIVKAYTHLFDWESFKSFFFIAGSYNYIAYNYPYWSLLVEVLFYAAVPFVVFRKNAFAICSLAMFVLSFFLSGEYPILNYICKYSIFFALGFILFDLLVVKKIKITYGWLNVLLLNVISFGLIIAGQLIFFSEWKKYSYILTALGGSVLIFRILTHNVKNTYLIRILKSLGNVSYSMYLIHVPFFIVLYALFVKYTGTYYSYSRIYWIAVLLFVPIGYLFYYLVELRSLNLITAFKKKLEIRNSN